MSGSIIQGKPTGTGDAYRFDDCISGKNSNTSHALSCGKGSYLRIECNQDNCQVFDNDTDESKLFDYKQNESTSYFVGETPKNFRMVSPASKLDDINSGLLAFVEFEKPYIAKDGTQVKIISVRANSVGDYKEWREHYASNILGEKFHAIVESPAGGYQKPLVGSFKDATQLQQFRNSPQTFILTADGKAPVLFNSYDGDLKDAIDTMGTGSAKIKLVRIINTPAGAESEMFTFTNWLELRDFATSFSEEEMKKARSTLVGENGSKGGYRGFFGLNVSLSRGLPTNAEYHEAVVAQKVDNDFQTDANKLLLPSSARNNLYGSQVFGGIVYYPGQDYFGFGLEVALGGAKNLFIANIDARLELSVLASLGKDFPYRLLFPVVKIGYQGFTGNSIDAQLYSNPHHISANTGHFEVGPEFLATLPGTDWQMGLGAAFGLVLPSNYNESRLNLNGAGMPMYGLINLIASKWTGGTDDKYTAELGDTGLIPGNAPIAAPVDVPTILMPSRPRWATVTPPKGFNISETFNFAQGKADLKPGKDGVGKIKTLAQDIGTKLVALFPKDQYPSGIPDGWTLILRTIGNTSQEGSAENNWLLGGGRGNTIAQLTFGEIDSLKKHGVEPFARMNVNQPNFTSDTKGETKPIELAGRRFSGNENKSNENRKTNKFKLCDDGREIPDLLVTPSSCSNIVEADMLANRRADITGELLPPGAPILKPIVEEISPALLAKDSELAKKVEAKFKKPDFVKSVSYSESDNSFNIVLGDAAFTNMAKTKTAIYTAFKKAAATSKNKKLSYSGTVRFWVSSDNPPDDYQNKLTAGLYNFSQWAATFGGKFQVATTPLPADKNNAVALLNAQISAAHRELTATIPTRDINIPGFPGIVKAIPVKDLANPTVAEQLAIAGTAKDLSVGDQKLTLEILFKGDVNATAATTISNIVGYSYFKLEGYNAVKEKDVGGNYVAIISDTNSYKLDDYDAAKEGAVKTIVEGIFNGLLPKK